jgi:hypothetical protein
MQNAQMPIILDPIGSSYKFEHQITFNRSKYHLISKMEQWCSTTIGTGGWLYKQDDLWNVTSIFGNTTFKFKQHSHYMLFLLKWD